MLKLTVAVLAVVLASSASAAGWRKLLIDGSSDTSFQESMKAFNEKLPQERRYVFVLAMQDILVQRVEAAKAIDREYTASDYHAELDGLGYREVVTLLDPTGQTARARYRKALGLYARESIDIYYRGPECGVAC